VPRKRAGNADKAETVEDACNHQVGV